MREILEACRRVDRGRRPAVLATVVKVAGSTYRKPGARMLFPAGGDSVGMVSGGCLEADLSERAQAVLDSGEPQTVVYDMRSPDDLVWGLGLGCNGEVRVLLEPLLPGKHPEYLDFLQRCLRQRRAAVLVTIFAVEGEARAKVGDRITVDAGADAPRTTFDAPLDERLITDAKRSLAARRSAVGDYELPGARVQALLEYVAPPVSLVVFGAGSDAQPLVRFAAELGWQVTVADDRPAYARAERFPDAEQVKLIRYDRLEQDAPPIDEATPVVVMTHHFLHDLDLLQFLARCDAPYLGFLGPRQRTQNLLQELAGRGARPTANWLRRLHAPVGVDIGSETPEEIAIAAIAEIRAVLSGRQGGFLRDRRAALHEWP
jgi:xanthine/CO dehydrogenase XdhC/CoxF family maturation factor